MGCRFGNEHRHHRRKSGIYNMRRTAIFSNKQPKRSHPGTYIKGFLVGLPPSLPHQTSPWWNSKIDLRIHHDLCPVCTEHIIIHQASRTWRGALNLLQNSSCSALPPPKSRFHRVMFARLGVVRKPSSCTKIEKNKVLQYMWKTESEEPRLHEGRVGLELYISLHSPCRNGRSCRLRAFY